MKFRLGGWILLSTLLLSGLIIAEILYRQLIHRRLESIQDRLRATHPNWEILPTEFLRFGKSSSGDSASLIQDVWAFATWKMHIGSPLDFYPPENTRNGYFTLHFSAQKEPDRDWHAFIWSPRRMQFVPWRYGSCCHLEGCEWVAEVEAEY